WTPEEDNLLRLAVQLYGDKTEKWAKIAACVPGRTNKNCRKRWFHSLDPSLRKGAWTDEEDQLLREGVMRFPNQWSKIADMLEGRTDDQCAKRWRESLDPSIDRSDWTPAEDQRLMEKYEEYSSQWQKIAQFFDGRPGLHCRNRWRKLQRMM
ncbi:Homeodomain-like protein, partial [Phascolomyces articulosus]